ncbi:MAG: hypothetical protein ACTSU5_20080 [Promethearchaeota archaeon]
MPKVFKNPNKPKFDKRKKEKEPMSDEDKLYWSKALMGIATGIVGRLVGLIGWWMLIWMLLFWFVVPFPVALLIHPYNKGEKAGEKAWDWKLILKTGIGAFFSLFMLTSTFVHTLFLVS